MVIGKLPMVTIVHMRHIWASEKIFEQM